MGNEAAAQGAICAGVGLVCGYPGTPSTEVLETVAARNPGHIRVQWSVNEKVALEVAAGAAYAGVRVLVTMKQMGLNVAADPLMCLNYIGVKGGMVVLVADDPGPISSQTEQDTRHFGLYARIPVFDPGSPEEAYLMIQDAFDFSVRYATPVLLRMTTRVCHACAPVDVEETAMSLYAAGAAIDAAGTSSAPGYVAGLMADAGDMPPQAGFVKDIEETRVSRSATGFVKDSRRWVIFPALSYQSKLRLVGREPEIAAAFSSYRFNRLSGGGAGGVAGARAGASTDSADVSGAALGVACGGVSRAYVGEALSGMSAGTVAYADADGTGASAGASAGGTGTSTVAGTSTGAGASGTGAGAGMSAGAGTSTDASAGAGTSSADVAGLKLLEIATPYPFPEALALAFLEGLEQVLVVEELDPVIEDALVRLCGKHRLPVRILGKRTGHMPVAGENSVAGVDVALRAFMSLASKEGEAATQLQAPELAPQQPAQEPATQTQKHTPQQPATQPRPPMPATPPPPPLPDRPPVLCAGCPHRAGFYAVKTAMKGHEAVFSGDIGCYTLGNAKPLDMVDTCLCMGAGITIAQGLQIVEPGITHFAFIGDSTFFHSGLPGFINAVYNQTDIVLVVMDNHTTAMTGSQPHPGTGRNAMGETAPVVSIERLLGALDIPVWKVDSFDTEAAVRAVREAANVAAAPSEAGVASPTGVAGAASAVSTASATGIAGAASATGPTGAPDATTTPGPAGVRALLFTSPCAAIRKSEAPYQPDEAKCTGCGLCAGELGCPALHMTDGKAFIERGLCTGCGLCARLCPSKCIVRREA